jgi:hypothetical protein
MIFLAFALPMPFNSKSSFVVALFKSTSEKRLETVSKIRKMNFKIVVSLSVTYSASRKSN